MERELYILGSDVVALFPSMTAVKTGKVAREQAVKTSMVVDGMDYKEMARYAWLGERDGLTSGVEEVRRLLPVRNSTQGTGPGFKNREVKGPEKHMEVSWTFPNYTPTEKEKKDLFGIMVEIGVRFLFTNFCYAFGGKIYLQQSGGPIGARITMAASRLRMYDWGEKYSMILWRSSIYMYLSPKNYVDDVRQATDHIKRGVHYDKEVDTMVYKEEWKIEDDENDFSDLKRMGLACMEAMNSVAEDLTFTVETEEDFENGRLQTLDFEMWFDVQEGVIKHSFFEKKMQTPLVIMERSAMGIQQKYSISANDLVRRLSNMGKTMTINDHVEVVDKFTYKLKASGYSQGQAREIVISGVRGYKSKVERRKRAGQDFYRSQEDPVI